MRYAIVLVVLLLTGTAQAALIDYGSYNSDDVSGLDWLDFSATLGMNHADALANNSGWRYATEVEVEDLFFQSFVGYYETNSFNFSSTSDGAYADQAEDVDIYGGLFGVKTGRTVGFYEDDEGFIRLMGALKLSEYNSAVYGMGYDDTFAADYSSAVVGTYMVRVSMIPVPAAVWLFGSALAGLGWLGRRQTV
jgi:hypothetical protein